MVLWFVGLVGLIIPWLILNLERDPSIQSGVTFGAGVVAYVLMGATVALVYVAHSELAALLGAAREAEVSRLTQIEKMEEARMDALRPFVDLVGVDPGRGELEIRNVGVGPASQGEVRLWVFKATSAGPPTPGQNDFHRRSERLHQMALAEEPHFAASFGPIEAGASATKRCFPGPGESDAAGLGLPVDVVFEIKFEDVFHRTHVHGAPKFGFLWG